MQTLLLIISILIFVASIAWLILQPGFEPLIGFLTGAATLVGWFASRKPLPSQPTEHDRRVMLDQVETAWVKGILEESLHGLAMIELGMVDEPDKVQSHPWRIERDTGETLPVGMSMLDIFREVGKGRSLLILGAPGSGKTTMLLELARQWIKRARDDVNEPIPVVFNLSSWSGRQTIEEWLADELRKFYGVPKNTGEGWVAGNQLALLLDGLDEVRQERRGACVEAINKLGDEHGLATPMVVCSRSEEYGALGSRLDLGGAITLQPLTDWQVDDYLDRARGQLAGVQALLREDPVLRELTETPLTLSIMTLAYKGMSAEELRGFPMLEARREHLFETYAERMFQRPERPGVHPPHSKEQVRRWLAWLARKLIQYDQTVYLIERMQPAWLETDKQLRSCQIIDVLLTGLGLGLTNGLVAGLISGTSGLIYGLVFGLSFGLTGGLVVGLISGLEYGGLAVSQYLALRAIIARNGYLPWRLVPFLDYAADRVLLRKVGGGYMFIHRLMMEYFAASADQYFS